MVQQNGVTYGFLLNFSQKIPYNGKLIIRFPSDYSNVPQFTTSCLAISGFNSTSSSNLNCSYSNTTRMLTITQAFATSQQQIKFNVSGVTNPISTQTTASFQISSYSLNGTNYVLMETGGTGITVTPTAGQLTSQSLTLSNPTVGVFSVLTLQFVPQHPIPMNGQIIFKLPKWNQFDPTPSNYESMIEVNTSPGEINCLPQLGLLSLTTSCVFTQGATIDEIVIQLSEAQNVQPGTLVSMLIQGVRAPPSKSPVTGFYLQTTVNSGFIVDQVQNSTNFQLSATITGTGSSSSVQVSGSPTTVNKVQNLTLVVQNMNPLLPGSSISIKIPQQFNIKVQPLIITTQGESLNPNPTININLSNYTIFIQNFNLVYLDSFSYSYFYINGMANPGQTQETDSFQISFFDQNLLEIESINYGVTYSATVNGFFSVALSVSPQYINAENAGYTFTLSPQTSFNSSAIMQITFPDQLWVSPGTYISNVSSNMKPWSQTTVLYNSQVKVQGAFPNGYQVGDLLQFTLTGIKNPPTTNTTQGISIIIYYIQGSSEIDNYLGDSLVFSATPSNQISISVILNEQQTGQTQSNMTFVGTTPKGMIIAQYSVVQIYIPKQFLISDPVRVAASCTAILGFTDEIICYFESVDQNAGAVLVVTGGFQSDNFAGGDFSFQISQILNPFTTEQTDAFGISVFSSSNSPLYIPTKNSFTLSVSPSDFAFSFIQSLSQVNGDSSMYQFSITLSVDTPTGTILQIQLPDQIIFDSSKPFLCNSTLGLASQMQCSYRNGRSIFVTLMPANTFTSYFPNGTTLEFLMGYMINPNTLKPSKSFQLATFNIQGSFSTQYIYINQRQTGLNITNQELGPIKILNITQIGSTELNKPTVIHFNLTTTNPIPSNSKMSIIFPTNFQLDPTVSITINNQTISGASIDPITYTLTANTIQDNMYNISVVILSGLRNPQIGPYSYQDFNIEFDSSSGWGVDAVVTQDTWINVQCANNCQSCSQNLSGCLQCGVNQTTGIGYYLYKKVCVLNCPAGFFGGSNYSCLPCKSPCLQCEFAENLCTQCDLKSSTPYSNVAQLGCFSSCPQGTYLDISLGQCLSCQSPCYTCNSSTSCLTCDLTNANNSAIFYYQHNVSCLNQCPNITVPSPSKVCVDCESPCVTCSELPEKCLTCIEGLYFYKNLCVSDCPWTYYKDNDQMQCLPVASMEIPFPFSILIICISIGVLISSCMDHHGKGKAAFFITCLAFTDILLRINWFVMGILALQKLYYYTFYGCCCLLGISIILNLAIWRRLFKFKYNFDDDDKTFITYCKNYPRTSQWLILLSYMITFQAIRLTYSNLFGKKQFTASFTRQKKFYRLIGQLSVLQTFVMFMPAIGLMIYSLWFIFPIYQQLWYLGIDSLFLVTYATILISITLTQREKISRPGEFFNWCEMCRCWDNSEDEQIDEKDEQGYDVFNNRTTEANQSRRTNKVMGAPTLDSGDDDNHDSLPARLISGPDAIILEQEEAMSATGFEDIKKNQKQLYQTEIRTKVQLKQYTEKYIDEMPNFIDYNELRKLEEKLQRIKLKTDLYENRRDSDYNNVQIISGQLHSSIQERDSLKKNIIKLQSELEQIQLQIESEIKRHDDQVISIVAKKREDIAKRSSDSNQLQQPFTLNSLTALSQSSPRQNLFNFDKRINRNLETENKGTTSSGYHNSTVQSGQSLVKRRRQSKNKNPILQSESSNQQQDNRETYGLPERQ